MAARQKFKAVLEHDGTSLGWTIVRLPFDPTEVWPQRNRLRVKGTINGFAFRTSLFRARQGHFILLVNKKMQKGAGAVLGSVAEVVLEPDTGERTVTVPPELEGVLRQDRALRRWHDALSDSYRKAIADRVTEPKSAAARARRAEQMAEWMMLAMEGERVTPPILEAAFQRSPRARGAWRAMTPTQRRGQLLGIFYYKSPEARQKRTQKAIEEALRIAEKKALRGESPGRR
jgi:uncharacterized protein YdeI (YjbR/CyaY-like superfamily)